MKKEIINYPIKSSVDKVEEEAVMVVFNRTEEIPAGVLTCVTKADLKGNSGGGWANKTFRIFAHSKPNKLNTLLSPKIT